MPNFFIFLHVQKNPLVSNQIISNLVNIKKSTFPIYLTNFIKISQKFLYFMYKNINYILQTRMFVKNALFSCTTLFSTIYCDHKCCLIFKNMVSKYLFEHQPLLKNIFKKIVMVRQGENPPKIPPKYHSGEKMIILTFW